MAATSASELRSTFYAWLDCIDKKKWDELPNYMCSTYVQDDIEFSHQAFVAHVVEAGASLGDVSHIVDTILIDERAQCLAAHVYLKCRPEKPLMGLEPLGRHVFIMEQRFVWFRGGKVAKISLAVDFDGLRAQLAGAEPKLDLMSAFPVPSPSSKTLASSNGEAAKSLEDIYKAYIDSINGRRMESELEGFCQPTLTHNAQGPLSVDGYRLLIQESISAIPDLHFAISTLITDESQQRVAARLEFTGTPVTEAVAGLVPNGNSVHFSEHVTYQFVDGKISRVWSMVNWDEARRQLTAS